MEELKQKLPGHIVSLSNYTLDQAISETLHSTLFLATDNSSKRRVIVKQFNSKTLDGSFGVAFNLEASVPFKVKSPFISRTLGYTDCAPFCIIFEYQASRSLQKVMHNSPFFLTPTHKTLIAMCTAHALSCLHKLSIVYRGLTPKHILIDQYMLPHLSNFGSAQLPDGGCVSESFNIKYLAPEMLTGSTYSEKVDVYSYGMILYELLTGEPPFNNLTPIEVQCSVLSNDPKFPEIPNYAPRALRELITACWSVEYSKRPSFADIYRRFVSKELFFSGFDPTIIDSVVRSIENNVEVVIPPWATKTNFKGKGNSLFENCVHVYDTFKVPTSEKLNELFGCANKSNAEQFLGVLMNIIEKDTDLNMVNTAVASVLHLMSENPCFMEYFIRMKLYEKLPLDKSIALNSILSLLIPVFEIDPKLATPSLIKKIATKIRDAPLKTFRIFATICNRFSNDWINWQVIDLLISNGQIFFDCNAGAPFLYTFYRMMSNFDSIRIQRGKFFAKYVIRAIESTDKELIQAAYPILTALNISSYKPKAIKEHLFDETLRSSALNYLCTLPINLVDPPILAALCTLSQSLLASSLLVKYAQDPDISKTMLHMGAYLHALDPRFLVKIILELMIPKENRPYLIQMPELPLMLRNISLIGDKNLLDALAKIIRRLPITAEFISKLSESGFITTFLQQAIRIDSLESHLASFLLMDPILHIKIIPEVLAYIETALGLISRAPQLLFYIATYLFLVSSFKEGAQAMNRVQRIDYHLNTMRANSDTRNLTEKIASNLGINLQSGNLL